MTGNANTAVASCCDSEDEGAWAAIEVEVEEPDWFELAIAKMEMAVMGQTVIKESPTRDWFYEVAEGEDKSDDEETGLEGALVNDVDRDALEGAFVKEEVAVSDTGACVGTFLEDSIVTGHIWPACNVFEGNDRLSGTLLGPCLLETPVAPVVHPEGEFDGGGTTFCESGGRLADLGVYENPWIDATVKWHTHYILQVSVENVTYPLDNPREEVDVPGVQVHESCDVGVIESSRDVEGLKMFCDVCEEYPLVLRFEGEEDIRDETMDLPVACVFPAPIESPVAEIFETMCGRVEEPPPNVTNPLVGCAKFSECLKTCYESPLGVRSFTLTSGASDFPSKVVRSKVYENTS